MQNRVLIFGAVISSFIFQSCSVGSSSVEFTFETPTPSPQFVSISTKIEYNGVSFTHDPRAVGDAEAKTVNEDQPLEMESDKPGENFPKHIEFSFGKDSTNKNRIAVVPIAEHRKMYAVSKKLTGSFDEKHKNLRKALDDENFRIDNEVPFIPFYDARQTVIAKVKKIPFQNGKSLCFLTQYEQETSLVNNEGIEYYCQGITTDEKYYFLAKFPLNVSFLPKDSYPEEFEGYKLPKILWNMSKDEVTQYEKYISKITTRINKLSPEEFEPNLNELEKIISTLKIE